MENFRELLHKAQTAELEGNLAQAMACLSRAASLCQEAGLEAKAQKLLRHLRRLEARVQPSPPLAPRPPPAAPCVFCKQEATGGWKGGNGLWMCRACLGKAGAGAGGGGGEETP
ncbi:MAG: hypothetical protein FWD46_09260 [Cystobacterineae bacterium]|nr:hypothetical protein [Cystobacterineae bacterium]